LLARLSWANAVHSCVRPAGELERSAYTQSLCTEAGNVLGVGMTDQQANEVATQLRRLNGNLFGIGIFLLGILVCFIVLLAKMR
jgi:hypothetical protein